MPWSSRAIIHNPYIRYTALLHKVPRGYVVGGGGGGTLSLTEGGEQAEAEQAEAEVVEAEVSLEQGSAV